MHTRNAMLVLALAAISSALSAQAPAPPAGAAAAGSQTAQTPAAQTPAAAAQTQAAVPPAAADLLQPALSNARETLMSLKVEKWKKGSVRDEAESNVNALLHDLDNNMQPLETAADAAPGQLSRAIPLLKHLDAFYDVMLRVEEASRVVAPAEQISAIQESLLRVSRARNAYDDVLQTQAAGQEKQIVDLQTAIKAEQQNVKDAQHQVEVAKASVKTEPCKPVTPAHRRRRTTPSRSTTTPSKPATTTGKSATAPPAQNPQQ
ncbi:MAG TPA: hypothetical protein VMD29_13235 [Terracidiphilus sp.]|nr:hypothetical protein [Terracidiphilus sp.]